LLPRSCIALLHAGEQRVDGVNKGYKVIGLLMPRHLS
jgi:hypothetical protein